MKVKTFLGDYEITKLKKEKNTITKNLAITLFNYDEEYEWEEEFATITINIPSHKLKENEAFIDINNCPWAKKFIEDYQLGKDTGFRTTSGYCTYPLYEFDLSKLKEYEENEDEEN